MFEALKLGDVIFFEVKRRNLSGGNFVKKRVKLQLVKDVDAFAAQINVLHTF